MKFIAAYFIISALFFSCNNNQKTSAVLPQYSTVVDSLIAKVDTGQIKQIEPIFISKIEDIGWKLDSLWVDSIVYPLNDTTKTGFLFQIYLKYPVLSPSSDNLEAIQKSFSQIISNSKAITHIQNAFDKRVEEYIDLSKSYEEELNETSGLDYCQSFSFSPDYISNNILIARSFESAYRGGAHNVFSIHYYNIDTNNGNIINESELFKPGYRPKLAELIQNEIERQNSSTDESEHIALLKDLSKINSNDNFYFENTGITYLYNVYEITGFVYGGTEIHLTYDKIISLVKDKYLPFIDSIKKEKIYSLKPITSEDGMLIHE